MSDLVGNPEDRFSHNEAHISLVMKKHVSNQSEQQKPISACTSAQSDRRLYFLHPKFLARLCMLEGCFESYIVGQADVGVFSQRDSCFLG